MNFIKKLDSRFKAIFLTTVVSLLAAHGMAIFNKLSFHDEAYSLFGVGATVKSGRWGLELLKRLSGYFFGQYGGADVYSMPVMACVYIIPLMALSLYLTVKLLDIKSVLSSMMLSGIFMTSFFFAALFLYNYTASYYAFGIFLSIAGGYLICACKKYYTYIAGTLLMCLSLSIYQAFYPMAASLILIYFIKEVSEKRVSCRDFIKKGVYYGFALAAAVVLYLASVKLSVHLTGIPLCNHKELDQMGNAGLMTYWSTIPLAYQKFFKPLVFFPFNIIYLYQIILLLTVILVIFKTVKLYKSGKLSLVQFIVLNLLMPLAINSIYVMIAGQKADTLMLIGQLMLFPYFFWLMENIETAKIKYLNMVGYISVFVAIWMFCRWDNVLHLHAIFMQQRAISYFTVLVSQIKNTEGYDDDYPVVFINDQIFMDKNVKKLPFAWTGSIPSPFFGTMFLLNTYSRTDFINNWLAYKPRYLDAENYEKLPEVQAMPRYPDAGSIKVINDVVVVKF